MEDVEIKTEPRKQTGTSAARRDRREGMIPSVLYGLGKDTVSLSLPRNALHAMLRGGKKMVDLAVGRKKEAAIIKEIQFHPVTDEIIHVDLERVALDEEITIEVAITLKGRAKGLDDHGVMDHVMHSIEVKCLPKKIPEEIILDVTDLDIGDSHKVSDLQIPQGVVPVPDPEEIVAVLHPPAAEEEEAPPEEEAPAEPEVITAAEREEAEEPKEEAAEQPPEKSE
jgi:large subunit ribosomal protein L25